MADFDWSGINPEFEWKNINGRWVLVMKGTNPSSLGAGPGAQSVGDAGLPAGATQGYTTGPGGGFGGMETGGGGGSILDKKFLGLSVMDWAKLGFGAYSLYSAYGASKESGKDSKMARSLMEQSMMMYQRLYDESQSRWESNAPARDMARYGATQIGNAQSRNPFYQDMGFGAMAGSFDYETPDFLSMLGPITSTPTTSGPDPIGTDQTSPGGSDQPVTPTDSGTNTKKSWNFFNQTPDKPAAPVSPQQDDEDEKNPMRSMLSRSTAGTQPYGAANPFNTLQFAR